MSTNALDRLIWPLIFIGMAVLGLGVAVAKTAAPLASPLSYTLVSAGALAIAIGVVLIVVRSRSKADDQPSSPRDEPPA